MKLIKMKYLHAHKYKRIGLFITPIGLGLWTSMQLGYIKIWLTKLTNYANLELNNSSYHMLNVSAAIIGFFSCLVGLYLISFAKEKREDEMIHQTRLESFQFAALLQLIILICGFVIFLIVGEPDKEGFIVFFVFILLQFWICYIARFNYLIHAKYRQ
jgi:ABC-type spermidine/putrescine transport system permease subunit I